MRPASLLLLLLPVLLTTCRAPLGEAAVEPRLYPVTDSIQPSAQVADVEAMIVPYRDQLTEKMNRELAVIKTPLTKRQPESSLGNWVADLLADAAVEAFPGREIALSVQNYGGLRIGEIGAGPLLVSEIYELMPFDNELVLVELSGKELMAFANHIANSGGWPVSRELEMRRVDGKLSVKLSGREIEPDKTYYIVTNDYVADGGSDSAMLVGKPQTKSGLLVRDLLIEYAAKSGGPIDVRSTGSRIKL